MDLIRQASQILRNGGLVAFPTETVYGLGADARQSPAVQRLFRAKGRPSTNPLIVHVADSVVARRYATRWPDSAELLARRFWPGPLTLVLPRSPEIVPEVSAGLDTIGLRCPDHPLTLQLLQQFDGPLAGPSANRSNRVSPTTAQHVQAELGDAVDLILDGGPCRVGIESTVLDLTGDTPRILRPGGISRDQLQTVLGMVDLAVGVVDLSIPALSPGQQAIHYAPRAAAYRFTEWPAVIDHCHHHPDQSTVVMSLGRLPADHPLRRIGAAGVELVEMPASPENYARHLYATLHAIDARAVTTIFIQCPPDEPQWTAIRDRIIRATRLLESD